MAGPWLERVREVIDGRPVIVAMDVLVAASGLAGQLRELGAASTLCLSAVRGTGEVDPGDARDALLVPTDGTDLMGTIRSWLAVLQDPPDDVRRRIDAFDPEGRAWVIQPPFGSAQRVAGRPVLGARPPAWVALEDKTLVDAIWDACGVTRATSRVVPVSSPALRAAAEELDEGRGTVWVADNRLGWHGGAQYLRWVRDPGQLDEAVAFLAVVAHHVRVMPFLEGVPCSIHGMVFDGHVAAFRPCEMVVLRHPGSSSLVYAGPATSWEPTAEDRSEMREVARSVGRHLDRAVRYRGVFTVDGVMTEAGFRPTELNPRFGAALGVVGRAAELPLYLLHLAVIERPDVLWCPVELEEAVLAAADANPVAQAGLSLDRPVREQRRLDLHERGGRYQQAADGPPDVRLELGPGPTGGYLKILLPTYPVGPAVAPAVVRALTVARDRFELDLPDLEAPGDPRARHAT